MRFLWPVMTGETSALRRAGRVCFWLGAGLSGLFAAIFLWSGVSNWSDESIGMLLPFLVIYAVPPYVVGRGLCYILAGE
jgi:hypothetical protein